MKGLIMKNILEDYILDDGTCPVTKAALEDLIEIHSRLFSIACLSMTGKKPQQTLDDFIWHVRHTNYFNNYRKVDDDRYDIEYYDADAKPGRIDSCVITVSINHQTGDLELCDELEFGVKGCDDLITYDLQDVIHTLNIIEQNT
jgi:hypothetical protein